MLKLANDFIPTAIIVLVMLLLAFWLIQNSNENQREIIQEVKQAQSERAKTLDKVIQEYMKDPEQWQRTKKNLNLP